MTTLSRESISFRRAVVLSITFHVVLFLFIILSPHLPKPSRKGMVHYVNVISLSGGGGSGGRGGASAVTEAITDTEIPERETLRDLTTPQKIEQEIPSTLRHPVEKPKRETKPPAKKKAVIQKPKSTGPPSAKKGEEAEGPGGGAGSGIRFGFGSGQGEGPGLGSSYSSQIGLSNFPFTYYLQIIIDRVSSNALSNRQSPSRLFPENTKMNTSEFTSYSNIQNENKNCLDSLLSFSDGSGLLSSTGGRAEHQRGDASDPDRSP